MQYSVNASTRMRMKSVILPGQGGTCSRLPSKRELSRARLERPPLWTNVLVALLVRHASDALPAGITRLCSTDKQVNCVGYTDDEGHTTSRHGVQFVPRTEYAQSEQWGRGRDWSTCCKHNSFYCKEHRRVTGPHQARFLHAFQHARALLLSRPEVQWLIQVDADSVVSHQTLLGLLTRMNHTQPLYLGDFGPTWTDVSSRDSRVRKAGTCLAPPYACGGSGTVLSREAVARMDLAKCVEPNVSCYQADWVLGRCATAEGVLPVLDHSCGFCGAQDESTFYPMLRRALSVGCRFASVTDSHTSRREQLCIRPKVLQGVAVSHFNGLSCIRRHVGILEDTAVDRGSNTHTPASCSRADGSLRVLMLSLRVTRLQGSSARLVHLAAAMASHKAVGRVTICEHRIDADLHGTAAEVRHILGVQTSMGLKQRKVAVAVVKRAEFAMELVNLFGGLRCDFDIIMASNLASGGGQSAAAKSFRIARAACPAARLMLMMEELPMLTRSTLLKSSHQQRLGRDVVRHLKREMSNADREYKQLMLPPEPLVDDLVLLSPEDTLALRRQEATLGPKETADFLASSSPSRRHVVRHAVPLQGKGSAYVTTAASAARRPVAAAGAAASTLGLAAAASEPSFNTTRDVCFVGGLDHPQNTLGLLWFLTDVWLPRVAAPLWDLAKATFRIFGKPLPRPRGDSKGSELPPVLKALANGSLPHVVHAGPVSELPHALLAACHVGVVPVFSPSGINTKTFETMRLGIPTVGLRTAFVGYELCADNLSPLVIGDKGKAAVFAETLIALYQQPAWENAQRAMRCTANRTVSAAREDVNTLLETVRAQLRRQCQTKRASSQSPGVEEPARSATPQRYEGRPMVWITGLPRSSSDMIGLVLTAARSREFRPPQRTLEPLPGLVREPFNIDNRLVCPDLRRQRGQLQRLEVMHYVWLEPGDNSSSLAVAAERLLRDALDKCGRNQREVPPLLVKDVVAFYSSSWIVSRFHVAQAVILRRNPFAWLGSMLRAGFTGDHVDCLSPRLNCSWARVLGMIERDHIPRIRQQAQAAGGAVFALAQQLDQLVEAARSKDKKISGLVLMYAVFAVASAQLHLQQSSWLDVRHEDLVVTPSLVWGRILTQLLGSAASHLAASEALIWASRPMAAGPTSASQQWERTYSAQRDSFSTLFNWWRSPHGLHKLPEVEALRPFASIAYTEDYWWSDYQPQPNLNAPVFAEASDDVGLGGVYQHGPGLGFAVGDLNADNALDFFFAFHFDAIYRPRLGKRQLSEPKFFVNVAGLGTSRRFVTTRLSELSDAPLALCTAPLCLNLTQPADFHSTSLIDVDGDGDDDLFIATGGGLGVGSSPHLLLRNVNGSRLEMIRDAFPPQASLQRGRVHAWVDVDGDSLLDVFIAGETRRAHTGAASVDSLLLLQRHTPASQGVSVRFDTATPKKMDLPNAFVERVFVGGRSVFVGPDESAYTLSVHPPSRTWRKEAAEPLPTCVVHCYNWYLDVYYCCIRPMHFPELQGMKAGGSGGGGPQRRGFSANSSGSDNATVLAQLTRLVSEHRPTHSHRPACAVPLDFDNDARTDLFVAYIDNSPRRPRRPAARLQHNTALFVNLGGWQFERRERAVLFSHYGSHLSHNPESCGSVDFDNDGRVDVLLGSAPFLWYSGRQSFASAVQLGVFDPRKWDFNKNGHPHLLHNRAAAGGRWVKLALSAAAKLSIPTFPLGTEVEVRTCEGLVLHQALTDGISAFVQGDRRLHFGLGRAIGCQTVVVHITWPDRVLSTTDLTELDCIYSIHRVHQLTNSVHVVRRK